jgi:cell wall-associated NlpC family hydrolase
VQQSQSALARGRAEYDAQRAALGTIAAADYRGGALDQQLRLLMAGAPETYLDNAAAVDQLSTEQLLRVAVVVEHQRELMQLQETAADQLARLSQARVAAAAAREQVEAQLREAQGLLNTLPSTQRQQIADNELGLDPAYEGGQIPESAFTNLLPVGRARLAIAAAFADLGKPYVFGAEGPDAFDCSGLMQRIWRQAGVDLPRTSSEQALAGRPVPLAAIEPGDMVIYYRGRSHIGLYIGDGKIIHAPHPGSDVRIAPVDSMPVNMVVRV